MHSTLMQILGSVTGERQQVHALCPDFPFHSQYICFPPYMQDAYNENNSLHTQSQADFIGMTLH